ncbi:MAG: winged helix-turn-helix domain-containing protein [Proteobacteria bacterium]|nr:winged helix-turn-helix domain-containing protein [Pseudomonadota bacterium]
MIIWPTKGVVLLETQSHLIIIDKVAPLADFIDYFAKFGIKIIHKSSINELFSIKIKPTALLIDTNVLDNPNSLATLYQQFIVPLIVTSEEVNDNNCIQALEQGADVFLLKPLNPREIHARISAISRRVSLSLKGHDKDKEFLSFADWDVYTSSRQIFNNHSKEELFLSTGEYELLLAFLKQPEQILDREFLSQLTKSSDLSPLDRRIDVQISRLRQKIEKDAKKPLLIKTIRNSGYLFTAKVISHKDSK